MRILLINPPHPSIGSRVPHEHLPPLGLLCLGGPLLDDGHAVQLLNADLHNLPVPEIITLAVAFSPDAILIGHSGSTSAHPVVRQITRAARTALPNAFIVYGGVFPTYHWREILRDEPQIDLIVRGEAEQTILDVMRALEPPPRTPRTTPTTLSPGLARGHPSAAHAPLCELVHAIPGIAYRNPQGSPIATPPAPTIRDLDAYRVGWELIDFADYSYYGDHRAVVVQFSRGCPHTCNYCGQHGFWTKYRYRDPVRFAKEIARLRREHGVQVFNLADENPTAHRGAWLAFLNALIAENVDVTLVASTRAGDIVRDADVLHLYKRAGVSRFLLGIETADQSTLDLIRKGSTTSIDRQAIQLLRKHNIISMAGYVVGFEEETLADYVRGLRHLLSYDPDQIQMVYVTPHRWTPIFRLAAHRRVVQTAVAMWDYKHQVLATRHLPPWLVVLLVKLTEVIVQMRPRSLRRLLFHPERQFRQAMAWYYRVGRRVWFYELARFFLHDRPTRTGNGPTLTEFWGEPQDHEEKALAVPAPRKRLPLQLAPT